MGGAKSDQNRVWDLPGKEGFPEEEEVQAQPDGQGLVRTWKGEV